MPYKDKDARRANARAYREKNRAKITAYAAEWRARHKEERKQKDRVYRENHRVEYAAYDKERAKKPERYETWKKSKKKWLSNNPHKVYEYHKKHVSTPSGRASRKRSERAHVIRQQREREHALGRPKPSICEACGQPPNGRGIVFDHCHASEKPRGWLCWTCNVILGHARDNPAILLQLIAYLKRTSNGVSRQMSLPGI